MNFRFRRCHQKSLLIAFLILIVVVCLNKYQFLPIDITDTILIKSHSDEPNAKSESKTDINKNDDYDNLILSIPENVIEKAPRIPYISGIKNPCFASFEGRLLENVTIGETITKGYTINCLPYFFLAGMYLRIDSFEFYKCDCQKIKKILSNSNLKINFKKCF